MLQDEQASGPGDTASGRRHLCQTNTAAPAQRTQTKGRPAGQPPQAGARARISCEQQANLIGAGATCDTG